MAIFVKLTVFVVLAAFAHSLIVLPPACTSGGGSSVSIFVYVTNLTQSFTELTANQPYNLTAGCTYNVTFGFIPTTTTEVQVFKVIATISVDGVPEDFLIASTSVPPYDATTVSTVLSFCPLWLRLQILLTCALNLTELLQLDLLGLLSCAGDSLATTILTYVPSQVTATVNITVPNLANGTAIFSGIIGDDNGNVVACRQGNVFIIGQ